MLWKRRYYLIILIIALINYFLLYLARHQSPPSKVTALRGGDMKSTDKPYKRSSQPAVLPDSIVITQPKLDRAAPDGKRTPDPRQVAVLIMACNRAGVTRCIDSILSARKNYSIFPVIVSQDCDDAHTKGLITAYKDVQYIYQPNQTLPSLDKKLMKLKGYFRISRHYKWALSQVFFRFNYSACIVVEDDLEVSPDFFEYFLATLPILQRDPSLYCVSAWNDNGKADVIDSSQPGLIHRTDFFPGLGWMLLKQLWLELEPIWPDGFWDDWLRMPQVRKGRSCLRPEMSRTETFGVKGVSNGLHFTTHLQHIKKYAGFFKFTNANLSYLNLDAYEENYLRRVYSSPMLALQTVMDEGLKTKSDTVRVVYKTKMDFVGVAKKFKIMHDFKSGVARTAYRGVVSFRKEDKWIYLCPIFDWVGYNVTWN